jgi:hypothetical protein
VLHELKICRHAPGVSHLLFADDTMLFLEVTEQQAIIINKVLRMYERCTGQLINPTKFSIMFGSDCSASDQEAVKNVLKVENIAVSEKYLGLPTPEGRLKKERFLTMKERFTKRFTNWAERNMSSGAKEVLIKSVAQAIPTYTMGVFKLSANLCDEMTHMICYFWCGEEAEHRKVHWIAWEKMLIPKAHGGIGFQDFRIFNQALLARQAWRLIQYPESLCARILKAKYYPRGELIDTVFPGDASQTW